MLRPKSIPYSFVAQLTAILGANSETHLTASVDDSTKFPDVAEGEIGYVVFCASEKFDSNVLTDYETCTYTGKSGNDLTGLTRGVEGTVQEWPIDTFCACMFTADAHELAWDVLVDIESTLTEQGEEWVVA